ncbi:MAG TPA: family 16 glycoside hydrolase, partial [Gemmatirosa sp.]
MRFALLPLAALAGLATLPAHAHAQPQPAAARHEDTEVYTPVPPVVTPAADAGLMKGAPADAIVLFGTNDLAQWTNVASGGPAGWTVADGVVTVVKPAGNIQTTRRFTNYQLHLEWRVPANITGTGQL